MNRNRNPKASHVRWLSGAVLVVALMLGMTPGVSAAGPWFVSTTGNDGNDCLTAGTACLTIQAAVGKASPGDTINVAAGTYNERLTIGKSLNLHGAQAGVDPTPAGARTNVANESVIDITGLAIVNPNVAVEIANGVSDVQVVGFTIKGSPTFHYADEAVIRAWSNGITVKENIMDGYYGMLYKGPGSGVDVSRNRMTVNKVGITVQPNAAANVTISGNTIAPGGAPAADAAGIYLTGCTDCTVTGNSANNFVGSNGLGGSNLTRLNVSGNTFTGNRKGVNIWGTTTVVTIADNTVSNSSANGIEIKGQDIDISGNFIHNNAVGIYIGHHVLTTQNVTIFNNSISGNSTYGVQVATTDLTADASRNWWGSATGPTHASNAGGAGDQASDNMVFTPWLCDGTDTQPGTTGFQPDPANLCAIPTRLVFTTQPGDALVGNPLMPQPVLQAQDAAGNLGINFQGPVTLAIGTNPGGGTLTGANPVNAVNGVATFAGLSIDSAGTGYTLAASAAGLAGAISNAFNIIQPTPVPTLSEWGLLLLVGLVAGYGMWTLLRRSARQRPLAG